MRYKKGIIIGKFMPPHLGHIALVEFGASNCEELLVVVGSRPTEPIPGALRYGWMKKIFKGRENIKIVSVRKDLPQDKEPSRRASRIWAQYLNKRFGDFDVIFSSEGYGDFVAEYMKAESKVFDLERKTVPVSGTKIRNNPFKYWQYIPETVRPYFVKRICIYGPESCGKSTMTEYLANHYKTSFIPEYARGYIEKRNNNFSYEDMEKFVMGQKRIEKIALRGVNKLLFCDTDFITTKIYSQHCFGKVSEKVDRFAASEKYDLYLFMDIDIPFEEEPGRFTKDLRLEFREKFLSELRSRKLPYVIISGQGEKRFQNAIKAVDLYIRDCF